MALIKDIPISHCELNASLLCSDIKVLVEKLFHVFVVIKPAKRELGGGKSTPAGPDPNSDAAKPNPAGANHGEQGPVPRGAKTIHVCTIHRSSSRLRFFDLPCLFLRSDFFVDSLLCVVLQRQTQWAEKTKGEAGRENHGSVQILWTLAPQKVCISVCFTSNLS